MQYYPLNYEKINMAAGRYNPSMVKSYNNQTYAFWERSLYQRAISTLVIGLPDAWKGKVKDFFMYVLVRNGYLTISENAEFGKYFQPCTLSGYDFYYQPTDVKISNPKLSAELTIGKDCELIKLTPDYMGAWDIISYYAEKLSVLDNAINMSLINNKYAFFMGARNKAAGEAIKKMLDKVNKGEPAVVYDMKLLNDPTDKAEPWQFLERKDLKSSYLTTDQLIDFQTLINNFDAEIGIPTVPYQKKERMVTSEADSRQIDSTSRSVVWFNCLKDSFEEANKHYDLGLTVALRYPLDQEGGTENGKADTNRPE